MSSVANLPDCWRIPFELGFSVFPVVNGEKRPALRSWKAYQSERAPLDTVAAWSETPSNVGIVTGAVSGILVLDLDSAEAIAEAEACGLPDTITVRTGKGRHFYFEHPGGIISNRAGIFQGADIRGDGGYVVGAGSIHPSGAKYEWEHPPGSRELKPAPAWLLELVHTPALIAQEVAKVRTAPPGGRNDQLNKSAFRVGSAVRYGKVDQAAAQAALVGAALDAGLGLDETKRTLGSG